MDSARYMQTLVASDAPGKTETPCERARRLIKSGDVQRIQEVKSSFRLPDVWHWTPNHASIFRHRGLLHAQACASSMAIKHMDAPPIHFLQVVVAFGVAFKIIFKGVPSTGQSHM